MATGNSPLKDVLDAVFPPEFHKRIRVTITDKQFKRLRDGQTLIFKVGKQTLQITREK